MQPAGGDVFLVGVGKLVMEDDVPAHSMRWGTFSVLSEYVIILLCNFASRFIDLRQSANRLMYVVKTWQDPPEYVI